MVDISNPIEKPMLSGIYERDLNRTIKHFVKSNFYCIDVGANISPVTLLMAKLVGPDGRVLSIEPGPPYYQKLLSNRHLNPSLEKNITSLNMGISDEIGSF